MMENIISQIIDETGKNYSKAIDIINNTKISNENILQILKLMAFISDFENDEIVDLLTSKASKNKEKIDYAPLLTYACRSGSVFMMKKIIPLVNNSNVLNEVLHYCSIWGNVDLAKMVINKTKTP